MNSPLEAAKKLDLDSQIQLLSRIQFITRFSSHLLLLSGAQGSGKTWLAHDYLEHYAQDAEQVLLTCLPEQTAQQQRNQLLQQFNATPMFNEQDSLLQSAKHLLPDQIKQIIIIDDAHCLAPELLTELWDFIGNAQAHSGWHITMLLLALPDTLSKPLAALAKQRGSSLLELTISDLSQEEVSQFSEMLLHDEQLGSQARRALKSQLSSVQPRPGALQQLPQQDVAPMTKRTASFSFLPWIIGGLLLITLVVGGGLYFSQPTKPLAESSPLFAQPNNDTDQALEVVIDDVPLPHVIDGEGLTVGRNTEETERVVVPSQLVDAILDEQGVGGSGKMAVMAFNDDAMTAPEVEPSPSAVTLPTDETMIGTASTVVQHDERKKVSMLPTAVTVPAIRSSITETELRAMPPRHYAVQLSASPDWNDIQAFVQQTGLPAHHVIYETVRDGQVWFIVVVGDYRNVQEARDAIVELPDELKAMNPWPKSYQKIQQEMERLK